MKKQGFAGLLAALALFAGASAHAEEIKITDLTGKIITLEKPAERIIAFPVPMASMVIALDQGADRLIAAHPEAYSAIAQGILGEFFPKAKALGTGILAGGAAQGSKPNVEAIAALRPDLVLQWAHAGEDNIAPLVNAGLNTAIVVSGDDDTYVQQSLTMLGQAIGKPERAKMINDWHNDVIGKLQAGLKGVAEDKKPKVAYFFYSVDKLWTVGNNYHDGWQIGLTGGRNAAADIDKWKQVSVEQVAAWNPEVIFISTFEDKASVKRFYDDPVLGLTDAAKNKRVYQMPMGGYRWDPGSAESPLGWMWLADILQPDLFNFDLRAEIKDWYPKLYGQTPTDKQIDAILRMDMNAGAKGYERFAGK
ncbi:MULTISPECIES: ABC transporter substrate-binding protein [unclassified Rhizobium]|uniref:ABC transporter substrate-binding protein n=1 Tax=unclassified Rhizobium TaxID=2613769 RepID=UPI00064621CF|nr:MULTISPECIES: ABC transporter substrate-binding protein [unclassified Rhizobium]OJY79645.1 MAG: hypothetical protein BGP09_08535 [Rhizobium sp. 60-20]RKD50718.1 iron complex transport system substrate-binding protein [Rhizobium sp. WW_1]